MPETPDTPDLKPAGQNPWYLLMTVCGEQDGEVIDWNLHARNRQIWNRWAAGALGEGEKAKLVAEDRVAAEDLAPLTADETARIETRFAEAGLSAADIPAPKDESDLSRTRFEHHLVANGFVFPSGVRFEGATFERYTRFDRATLSRDAIFDKATFSMLASFRRSSFAQIARFNKVTFAREALFEGTTISGTASYKMAVFSRGVLFNKVTFSGHALLPEAAFSGRAGFGDCTFGSRTSFSRARFETEPLHLYGATLHEDTDWSDAAWPAAPKGRGAAIEHRRAYERLKLLMAEQHKFRDEHFFLRKEFECGEVVDRSPKNIPSRLYGFLSDYGASIGRPLAGLSLSTVLGAFVFAGAGPGWPAGRALALSASNQIAFFGFNRTLIGAEEILALPWWARMTSAGQTAFAAILLFLLLLALRNRFRIK